MGLEAKTLDNYDTKQNTYNTNAGFDWSDGNNPVYTLYDEDGSAAATTTYSDDGATITTAGQGMTGPGFGFGQ
jgi:hypothetical protein